MATILTGAQRRFFQLVLWLAVFMLANSLYLFTSHGEASGASLAIFYQVMLLAHLVGGSVLLLLTAIFVAWHLRRVRKLMRFSAVFSGSGLTVAAVALFGTGVFIISQANSREHRWVFHAHQALAVLGPIFYGVHRWVSHFPPARRMQVRCGVVFGIFVVAMWSSHLSTRSETAPLAAAAEPKFDPFIPFVPRHYPDKSSPFFPASTTTTSGKFLASRIVTRDELGNQERINEDIKRLGFAANVRIGADTCVRCHADIVAQWETSAHRFSSFNNIAYRAAVENMRRKVGFEKSQWCAGCHDPAVMLAGNMTKEIVPTTPESQAGLTCLACHAIDKIHGVEGNGNYNIADESPSPYLFDDHSDGWRRFLSDQVLKSKPAAHKKMFLKPFFRESEYCLTCHKVSLDVPVNNYRYIRGQDEYDNWHDSGVSHNAARTFYLPDQSKSCQDCHMPPEEATRGDLAARDGKVKSHRFLAVNTALPFWRGDFDTIARIEKALEGALRVDIFALKYADGTMVRALDVARPHVAIGEETIFEIVVRNQGVGHTFPGGTTDSNEAWLEVTVTDANGNTVYRSGGIDEDGFVDKRAHFYRTVMVRHDGTEATDRDPQEFHVPAFSRVIGPGSADVARYAITVPKDAGALRVRARLLWRKFNRTYTNFVFRQPGIQVPDLPHLKTDGPVAALPVTTLAKDEIVLGVARTRGVATPVDSDEHWMRFNDHGIASLLQGAFDVAEESFKEVARLAPKRPDGFRNQARRWIRSGTPARARDFLLAVDKVAPTDPQRPYFWGRYFERMEEYERAEKAYQASLEVFPNDRDAWRRLGEVRFKLQRYEDSLVAFLRVLKIDPEDLQSHKRRLDIYRQLGKEFEAGEAEKAFLHFKRDDVAEEVARAFLQSREDINHEAQRRHIHR